MKLHSLTLEQFRSYERLTLDSAERNIHLLIGPNAAGKTNILEAVSLLSLTRSCQGADEADLIRWGSEFYRVQATATTDEGESRTFEVASQLAPRKRKVCYLNDVQVSVGEMVGSLPTVLFLPQDLSLFSGPPQQRRTFVDQLLCQVSPEYLRSLSHYGKLLKQRNSLLKSIADDRADTTHLPVWDQQVAQAAAYVTLRRLELLEVMQCTLAEELQSLGESWQEIQLRYERKGTQREEEALQAELLELYQENRNRDLVLQTTTVGPHREDWTFLAEGRNIATFASRGQQRTAVLALLFLEVSYLELKRGERPVILLDDVFSELDDAHQEALLQSFAEHQVIITGTHVPPSLHGAVQWTVGEGRVEPAVGA